MKRLDKKGFTLVELIAAITILAVLMLIGSQAVMKVIRTTRANSVKKSLDNALKEARIMHVNGELPKSAAPSDLSSVLIYDKKDYTFEAFTDNDKMYLFVEIFLEKIGKFKSTKCSDDILKDVTYKDGHLKPMPMIYDFKLYYNEEDDKSGYYCCVRDGRVEIVKVIKLSQKNTY